LASSNDNDSEPYLIVIPTSSHDSDAFYSSAHSDSDCCSDIRFPSVIYMPQESSKRAAPTSPPGGPNRDAKRLRLATDLWSEDQHRQQDEIAKQRLRGHHRKPYDIDDELHMAYVFQIVGEVASEGPNSHMFYVSAETRHYIDALEQDPVLMKLVGDCYTNGSYKDLRCLGASFVPPVAIYL
jgi:hypothetical protein